MKKYYQFPLTESVAMLAGNICQAASPADSNNPLINETTMPAPGRTTIPAVE